ncbi:MAG TPA: ABC transporter substrate-binding protein, partial [Anaerolineaceae bacterium]|nr:ABC transporter substrate-binding protein [Anaerolineaceae bacterium]
MKRLLLLIVLTSLALAGCAPASTPTASATATPEAIAIQDGLDRQVVLSGPAKRIVSLAPSNTEILFAIGAGAQVVGRDELSDYPAAVKDLPSVGGSWSSYNYEMILSLQPDLVLAGEINTAEQVKAIEDLGIKVFYLKNPTTLEGMYDNLQIVGRLSGYYDEAVSLTASLQARVRAVDEKVAPLSYAPTVFYELDGSEPAKPWTTGAGTFIDLLISRAGGINIASALSGAYAQISLEELLVSDPQIILLGDAAYGMTPEAVAQR